MRTKLKASHIIGFQNDGHHHLQDGEVVWEDDTIIYVGPCFSGSVDKVMEHQGDVVTPGFINTHAHLFESPLDKSFVEDRGSRQFYLSGLFEYLPTRAAAADEEAARAALAYSMAEILRTGTTTVLEIGAFPEWAVSEAAKIGIRFYMGPMYRSGRWLTANGRTVSYEWDEKAGVQGMEQAIRFIEENDGKENGRIKGFLSPAQVDTCTEDLLRRSSDAARAMNVPVALHTSQSVVEFQEMVQRHGKTPIEWLSDIGFLGPQAILGHCIIVADTSWANFHGDDIGLLASTGTNVAHCVWVFARRGILMESFSRYSERGVNMTLGTDTSPQSMIEGLRWTATASKWVDRRTESATAADVFNAATLNGAKALGRDDIGRIAVGAKADLLVWNGTSIAMTPLRDPIKNIVYSADPESLRDVIIDGEYRMQDRQIPGVDQEVLNRDLQSAAERMWSRMGEVDHAGRTVDELSPLSFPQWKD